MYTDARGQSMRSQRAGAWYGLCVPCLNAEESRIEAYSKPLHIHILQYSLPLRQSQAPFLEQPGNRPVTLAMARNIAYHVEVKYVTVQDIHTICKQVVSCNLYLIYLHHHFKI